MPFDAMGETWVVMSHAGVADTATVTQDAFTAVWEPAGWVDAGGPPGPGVDDTVLREWVEAEAYAITSITYRVDKASVIDTATVVWPDGSAGVFTTTAVDTTVDATNAFTITHVGSGKTVTQAAVTRNASGLVTVKPALTIA